MAPDEPRPVGRRTALKTIGTAAVAAVGVSGTAAASHVQEGELVYIDAPYDVAGTENPCSGGDVTAEWSPGTQGYVLATRDCYYQGWQVHFQPYNGNSGWIGDGYVEPQY